MNEFIPAHLKPFVAKQHYDAYSPIDHAVWRYVMKQNHHFLEDVAHEAFTTGLKSSGINIDRIPKVSEMNEKLGKIGWGAVIVDGLIPGTAFFDFQAHGILPIATDIRQKSNILYTPAPDILHEAAGHAPILFDETYSKFVQLIGNIGANAFATKEEHEVFEATRHLSIVMENPASTDEDIREAKVNLSKKQEAVTGLSEAEQISRIFWWTVEFGLIGELDQPKIYGAGLLSSVGESKHSLSDEVMKRPFTIKDAIHTSYDVTSMQTQLFVCESFEQLIEEVSQFGETMAFRKGGTEAIDKAIAFNQIAHVEYNSGIQITGQFTDVVKDANGEAIYLKTTGPSALSIQNEQLPGHGTSTHPDGFGAPIGRLVGGLKLEEQTMEGLKNLGIEIDQKTVFTFESGVTVSGLVSDILCHQGTPVVMTFKDALVTFEENILFHPDWGTYDLVVGSKIISARPIAADHAQFYGEEGRFMIDDQHPVKPALTPIERLYGEVQLFREEGSRNLAHLQLMVEKALEEYPEEWLLQLELLEILEKNPLEEPHCQEKLFKHLTSLKEISPQASLIQNGLEVVLVQRTAVTN
jgi:phenylalanine-4-hydroxylase